MNCNGSCVICLEAIIVSTVIDNENNFAGGAIHIKHGYWVVVGLVVKFKINGAGLNFNVRELGVYGIDINNNCDGRHLFSGEFFGAGVGGVCSEVVEGRLNRNWEVHVL